MKALIIFLFLSPCAAFGQDWKAEVDAILRERDSIAENVARLDSLEAALDIEIAEIERALRFQEELRHLFLLGRSRWSVQPVAVRIPQPVKSQKP
jgi:hypothetical protein